MVAVDPDVKRGGELVELQALPENRGKLNPAVCIRSNVGPEVTHAEEGVFGIVLKIFLCGQLFEPAALLQEGIPGINLNIKLVVRREKELCPERLHILHEIRWELQPALGVDRTIVKAQRGLSSGMEVVCHVRSKLNLGKPAYSGHQYKIECTWNWRGLQ